MTDSGEDDKRKARQFIQFLEQYVLITDNVGEAIAGRNTNARLCRVESIKRDLSDWYIPYKSNNSPALYHNVYFNSLALDVFEGLRETRKDYIPKEGSINPEGLILLVDAKTMKNP